MVFRRRTTAGAERAEYPARVPSVLRFAFLLAAVGATGLGAQAATPGIPSFYVDYQPNCAFTMSVDPGTPMLPSSSSTLTLPPGTYQVIVSMPNMSGGYVCARPAFTLNGPGVSTRVEFAGFELHDEPIVTLQPSSVYVAQDESAPATTRRTFTTGASGSSSSLLGSSGTKTITSGTVEEDVVGSAIPRYRGKLTASVTRSGRATLKLRGRAVAELKAGKYDVVVDDRAARAGSFVRHGAHKAVPLTGASFVGQRTRRVLLSAGKWSFFAQPGSGVQFTVVA